MVTRQVDQGEVVHVGEGVGSQLHNLIVVQMNLQGNKTLKMWR